MSYLPVPHKKSPAFDKLEVGNVKKNYWKAFIATFLGTLVEKYDYALYGYVSALLAQKFFPITADTTTTLMRQFVIFTIGFSAKPIGSILFGGIGDRYGRKPALRWSILGIAVPTFLIGCLPEYQTIGYSATVLLLTCRFLQGIFISAESDGVRIFVYETISKRWACLANVSVDVSYSFGYALAAFAVGILVSNRFEGNEWAWRVPFLLGGILGMITIGFRKYLIESHDYKDTQSQINVSSKPSFWHVIKINKRTLFLATLLNGSYSATAVFFSMFWNQYLAQGLNLFSVSHAAKRSMYVVLTCAVVAPIVAFLADLIGPKIVCIVSALGTLVLISINAYMLWIHNLASIYWLLITVSVLAGFHAPIYIVLMQSFKIQERYRCIGLSHALGSLIFTSSTPLIATYSGSKLHSTIAPLFYCGLLILMGLGAVCLLKQPATKSNSEGTLLNV